MEKKKHKKSVAITGASGFLGRALLKRLEKLKVKDIVALAHSEQKGVEAMKQFPNVKWIIGDISDENIADRLTQQDIVFHLAAQKHIPIGENYPTLTVETNIVSTLNIMRSCQYFETTLVGVSTDKACNPETVYGMSKYFMERMFFEWNKNYNTNFYCCRYGNVGGSSGSVFEIWDKLGKDGKTLKLTDPDMTRFYFTVEDAVDTLMKTLRLKMKDKVYVPKMKAMRMGDVADVFAKQYGVNVEIVGNRGNEKVHEDLVDGLSSDIADRYNKKEIKTFLKKINLLKK